jgi:gamma-glutamyltranspeptidase/glutathione hydrolase
MCRVFSSFRSYRSFLRLSSPLLFCAVLLLPPRALQAAHMPPTHASSGMVVCGHRLAAKAGIAMLEAGGNAVDAAVATAFAMAVVSPKDGNLGGGGFLVAHSRQGADAVLDFREVAPAAASRDMYLDAAGDVVPRRSLDGWLAVGVPGAVAGYLAAAERLGTLPRRQLLKPSIRLAEEGFRLDERDARALQEAAERLRRDPAASRVFLHPQRPWAAGDTLRQPDLAATLKEIALEGRDVFYRGRIAERLTDAMARNGGLITTEDLHAYRVVWRAPLIGSYRGHRVISMPPPSSGGVALLQMLAMTEPFDPLALGAGSSALIHLEAEVARRAFADRSLHLADPDHWPVPVAALLDPGYLQRRMADFDPARASEVAPGELGPPAESDHTTHISVMDGSGGAASTTVTLNARFGAAVMAPGTGFLLNDEMDDFSAKPGVPNQFGLIGAEANAIAPGKRPLSSMTPTIVTNAAGQVEMVVGSPGGSKIITTVYQVLVNVLDLGMDIQQAVSWPRVHHQWRPNELRVEPDALSADVAQALEARGHRIDRRAEPWSAADAIHVPLSGRLEGGADPRGPDTALGYSRP